MFLCESSRQYQFLWDSPTTGQIRMNFPECPLLRFQRKSIFLGELLIYSSLAEWHAFIFWWKYRLRETNWTDYRLVIPQPRYAMEQHWINDGLLFFILHILSEFGEFLWKKMNTALVFTDLCGDKEKQVCSSITLHLLYVREKHHKYEQKNASILHRQIPNLLNCMLSNWTCFLPSLYSDHVIGKNRNMMADSTIKSQ